MAPPVDIDTQNHSSIHENLTGNSSQDCGGPLMVNTNFLSNAALNTFLDCSNDIQKHEMLKKERNAHIQRRPSLNRAVMTREEIFEVSTLDEEAFLRALEDNGANSSSVLQGDLTKSIENLMKYFDEDVSIENNSSSTNILNNKIINGSNSDSVTNSKTSDLGKLTGAIPKIRIIPPKSDESEEAMTPKLQEMSDRPFKFDAVKKTLNEISKDPETPVMNFLNNEQNTVKKCPKEAEKTLINVTKPKNLYEHYINPLTTKESLKTNQTKKKSLYDDYKKNFDLISSDENLSIKSLNKKSKISPRIKQFAEIFDRQFSPIKSMTFFENSSQDQRPIASADKSKENNKILAVNNLEKSLVADEKKNPVPLPRLSVPSSPKEKLSNNVKFNYKELATRSNTSDKNVKLSVKEKITLFNKIVENKNTSPCTSLNNSKVEVIKASQKKAIQDSLMKIEQTLQKMTLKQLNSKEKSPESEAPSSSSSRNVSKVKQQIESLNQLSSKQTSGRKLMNSSLDSLAINPTIKNKYSSEVFQNLQKVIEDLRTKIKEPKSQTGSQSCENITEHSHKYYYKPISLSYILNDSPKRVEIDENHIKSLEMVCDSTINKKIRERNSKKFKETAAAAAEENRASELNQSKSESKYPKEELKKELEVTEIGKRNSNDMCSCIPIDVYGPPKKIRRTAEDRIGFVNPKMAKLFYEWLKLGNKFRFEKNETAKSKLISNDPKDRKPPENELQKSHDSTAALSEHQLRVQASLQRLNIPDWYRNYNQNKNDSTNNTSTGYKPGNFTRKRASDSGRWTGLNSKTTSLSSLGSHRSDRSPLLLSPSAHSHHGTTIAGNVAGLPPSGGFSRWSTSYLNSTQTSPSVSQRGSFSRGGPVNSSFSSVGGNQSTIRNSFRQPYMGWRSQEKINQPRTPHERLASSILVSKPPKPEHSVTPEIQTSIKEVTSAIVHHFNDANRASARSRSTSPNSRKCWLESSFVGVRPVESPQTPTLDNSFTASPTAQQQQQQLPYNNHHYQAYPSEILRLNGVVSPLTSLSIAQQQRSPSSASLEDVLASLLGLPTNDSYRSTSGGTANEMVMIRVSQEAQNSHRSTQPITTAINNLKVDQQNRFRRCSEGDAQQRQKQQENQPVDQQQSQQQHQQQQQQNRKQNSQQSSEQQISRRVSLDSSDTKQTPDLLIKCRNTKCEQTTNPIDAKKYFKSCHNCTFLYCSRECRRVHWEKHRKACLHSRVSNLCRQVLSACKDDLDTLRHLSLLARKGYLSQGRGVVRILFRSPENAENFIKNGFQCLGESSFVRWPDLMPAEMGLELYSELLRLSTEYKPESKMLIYVAICVVSEAPAAPGASVKWERQLVSRCAKLKLCKSIVNELSSDQQLQQQQQLHDTAMEILILTFNSQQKTTQSQREIILQNILCILNRRGVILKKHYPEIYQRLQTFADGQTERFIPVTLHPRDSQTGQGFVCIIMPTHNENELIKLPASEGGNKVCTIDVGEEMLES